MKLTSFQLKNFTEDEWKKGGIDGRISVEFMQYKTGAIKQNVLHDDTTNMN